MNDFIQSLTSEFQRNADPSIAAGQKAYLRNQFEFFGIKTETRRAIQKPFLAKQYLPSKEILVQIVNRLWQKPQREYHYFSQELVSKYAQSFERKDLEILEYMVINNSWWDTVDFIASNLMGEYFKIFPEDRIMFVDRCISTGNIWLQRSALVFQLKYKEKMDTELLGDMINKLLGSKEFFINKAIGWVLREYSKTNPAWVTDFVIKTELNNLSKKEAMRIINKHN